MPLIIPPQQQLLPPAGIQNFLAWSYDPVLASSSGTILVAGRLQLAKIWLPGPVTIGKICLYVVTAGATLTANANFVGLHDANGNRLGVSANTVAEATLTSTGFKNIALSAAVSRPGNEYVYASILTNGTTQPTILRSLFGPILNVNQTAAQGYRYPLFGSAQTTIPATAALGSMTTGADGWWMGLTT